MNTNWALSGHKIQAHFFTAEELPALFHEVTCWIAINSPYIHDMRYERSYMDDTDEPDHTMTVYWENTGV